MNNEAQRAKSRWTYMRLRLIVRLRRILVRLGLKDKTLWDWMGLLLVPAAVVILATLFQWSTSNANQTRDLDRERQEILQSFMRDMSALLLDRQLGLPTSGPAVRQIARSNTLIAIRRLDGARKRITLEFLYDSRLIDVGSDSVVDLTGIDLSNADLEGMNLRKSNLLAANLRGTNLRKALLEGANLSGAILNEADLREASLWRSDLSFARLVEAKMSNADLSMANLRSADLTSAQVSDQQLARASDLVHATMPDGAIMTEERWQVFKAPSPGVASITAALSVLQPELLVDGSVVTGAAIDVPPGSVIATSAEGKADALFTIVSPGQEPIRVRCAIAPGSSLLFPQGAIEQGILIEVLQGSIICQSSDQVSVLTAGARQSIELIGMTPASAVQ